MKKQLWVSSSAECAIKSKLPHLHFFPLDFSICVCVWTKSLTFPKHQLSNGIEMRWEERRRRGRGDEKCKKAHSTSIQLCTFPPSPLPPSSPFSTFLVPFLAFFSSPFSLHCWVVQVYPNPHAMFHSQLAFLFLRSSTIIILLITLSSPSPPPPWLFYYYYYFHLILIFFQETY